MEVFLKCRGNIKDVEKELGLSYPTVRNRLDGVLQALGYAPASVTTTDLRRQEIIAALSAGNITAAEAAQQLKKLRR